jgi:hypothetical protein
VDVLMRKLQECVLSSGNLDRLRRARQKQIDQRRAGRSKDTSGLCKQLANLDREIDRLPKTSFAPPQRPWTS